MQLLDANQRRQAVREALIDALKRTNKTCQELTGKAYVSALTSAELRSACAILNLDPAAIVKAAEENAALQAATPQAAPEPSPSMAAIETDNQDAASSLVSRETLKPEKPETEDRADAALAPLAAMRGMLAPAIWEALRSNVAGVYTALDGAHRDLAEARERQALVSVSPASEGETPSAQLHAPASQIFGVKSPLLQALSLPVWNAPDAPAKDADFVFDPALLEDLAICVSQRSYPWLAGPKGTGKTSAAMQLAARLGRPFFRIAFDEHTEPRDLLGGDGMKNASTYWQDGKLTQALRTPGAIVLLDEPTVARPGSLAALQTILDHGFVLLDSGERVDVAQDVIFMAADNTCGRGDESGHYVGTRPMNAAFLDRFDVIIEVNYPDQKQETLALQNRTGANKDLAALVVSFANKTRQKCASGDITEGLGFRRMAAFTRRLMAGVSVERAFKTAIMSSAHAEDKACLASMAIADLDAAAINAILSPEVFGVSPKAADESAAPQIYKSERNKKAADDFSPITAF